MKSGVSQQNYPKLPIYFGFLSGHGHGMKIIHGRISIKQKQVHTSHEIVSYKFHIQYSTMFKIFNTARFNLKKHFKNYLTKLLNRTWTWKFHVNFSLNLFAVNENINILRGKFSQLQKTLSFNFTTLCLMTLHYYNHKSR